MRYSVNEMRKKVNETREDTNVTEDLLFRTVLQNSISTIEEAEYVAMRAAIPIIPDMPLSDCLDDCKISYKSYTTQMIMGNENDN